MNNDEVTEQILGAWDEIVGAEKTPDDEPVPQEEETAPLEDEPEEEEPEPDEEPEEEEPEQDEPEEGDEAGEPEEGAEESGPTAFATDDPDLQAFLSKFQGDVGKALRYGLQSQQALSRLGQEREQLSRRAQELETQLAEASAFSGGAVLSEEQRNWVGEALESGNPILYVREAVRAQEFDLARAVCAAWGDHAPFEALRAAQQVDNAEAATLQAEPEIVSGPLDHGELLRVLSQHFPDLPEYADRMTALMERLGEMHPLVQEARSGDPEQAARGVINLYEIARESAVSTADARKAVKDGAREKARSERKRAVVSSAGASPSAGETPKAVRIGPGLTLEALEAEWARNS